MIYYAEDLWNNGSPYLEHKFGFKYIKKIPIGKGFRYFYSQAEIAAYKANKVIGKTATKARKTANKYLELVKVSKSPNYYTKKNETVYFNKLSKKNTNPNLSLESGVDKKGHKYIAKLTEGGKTRYFYSQEEYEAYKNRQFYQDSKNEPDFLKDYKETNTPLTSEEDIVSVNPDILEKRNGKNDFSNNPDYTTNCTECTMIYEMRRRGYDVEYNEKYNISASDNDYDSIIYNTDYRFSYCFEKPTTYNFRLVPSEKSFNSFMKTTYPPNSRGDITVAWKNGGAHSMIWETDSKGRVTIKDAQMSGTGAPTTYKPEYLFKKTNYVQVTRLDNLKPKKNIRKVIQNKTVSNNTLMRGYKLQLNSNGELTRKQYSNSEMYTKYSNTI